MNGKLNALVVCKHSENSEEGAVCRLINHNGFKIKYAWKNSLIRSDLEGVDFVISIGGDGTALSASHYLENKPLLAVNSDPGKSEGALTTINIDELERKLVQIRKGDVKTEKLERISVSVNGKIVEPIALNEVFISNSKAYLVSRYNLRVGDKVEEQKSSGLIFSTGTGSTAWFKSSGGEPFGIDEKFIKMIVREPLLGRLGKFNVLNHTIEEGESVIVEILTPSVLAIDSIREIELKKGDEVKIRISDKPLFRVT